MQSTFASKRSLLPPNVDLLPISPQQRKFRNRQMANQITGKYKSLQKQNTPQKRGRPLLATSSAEDLLERYLNRSESILDSPILAHPALAFHDGTSIDELLLRYSLPYSVTSFLINALDTLIPRDAWGCKSNWSLVKQKIAFFVSLNRYERMSEGMLLEGLKISTVSWLGPSSRHQSPNESRTRSHIFKCFIVWVWNSIVVQLLSTNFYCTESVPHKSKLFYYRRVVWSRIEKIAILRMKSPGSQLTLLTSDQVSDYLHPKRLTGIGILRFLPKSTGLRPILNLRFRDRKLALPAINTALRPLYAVLRMLVGLDRSKLNQHINREHMRSSFLRWDVMYRRILAFKKQLQSVLAIVLFCIFVTIRCM